MVRENAMDEFTMNFRRRLAEEPDRFPTLEELEQWKAEYNTLRGAGSKSTGQSDAGLSFSLLYEAGLTQEMLFFWMSVLVELTRRKDLLEEMTVYAVEHMEVWTPEQKLFVYEQLKRKFFANAIDCSEKMQELLFLLLKQSVAEYRSFFPGYDRRVPASERRADRVLVLISQMLGVKHAPTAFAMEYCRVLIRRGYQVLLINVADVFAPSGAIRMLHLIPNYLEQLSEVSQISYEDVQIPFFQCPQPMPDREVVGMVLQAIRSFNPAFVFSMGEWLVSGVIDPVYPVYSHHFGAGLPYACTSYQKLENKITPEQIRWLKETGADEDAVIYSGYAVRFPEKTRQYSRVEEGIPDEAFCIVLVGNRLTEELNTDFLVRLEQLAREGFWFCFVGSAPKDRIHEDYPLLDVRSSYIPFAEDLLSFFEICDIYLNPPRSGGGTSAIYALHEGKPVVTIKGCDVAANVGEEFCVDSPEELFELCRRYREEPELYKERSRRAVRRAMEVSDTDRIYWKEIEQVLRKEGF